jgi:hypothetical protein
MSNGSDMLGGACRVHARCSQQQLRACQVGIFAEATLHRPSIGAIGDIAHAQAVESALGAKVILGSDIDSLII